MFGELLEGTNMWCLHCRRTYKIGEYREIEGTFVPPDLGPVQMCPYEDCDGDAVIDADQWKNIMLDDPKYPKVPERGVVYP